MNAKEILNRKFEKAAFNGYKTEDVDEFLKEVSDEFAMLQKEKSELERKLEVLADKIREYREDEDALKDALLIAQKQGNAIVAESKASAEKLTKETDEAIEKKLAETKARVDRTVGDADEYSRKTRQNADETAAKIIKDANDKAAEIKALMDKQQEIQENILQETRKNVNEYRARILAEYQAHIELLESLPDKCEDDYVKRVSAEVEKREAERRKQKAADDAKAQKAAAEAKAAAQKKAEAEMKKAAEKKADAEQEPFKAVEEPAEKPANEDKTDNLPFFNSSSDAKPQRHSDLKFGKNNENK